MERQEIVKQITCLPLFAKTDHTSLEHWLCHELESPKRIPAGERIDPHGERVLGILLKGTALIYSADSERNVLLRSLHAPGIFGAATMFSSVEEPMSRIEAKSSCLVLYASLKAVKDLLSKDDGFRDAYLAFLADRVRFLNRKILCFTAGNAERRLALWLISQESETLTLPTSLSALADMLDIGRATLYRSLDKLEEEGLIRRDGKTITLLSQENILKKYQ